MVAVDAHLVRILGGVAREGNDDVAEEMVLPSHGCRPLTETDARSIATWRYRIDAHRTTSARSSPRPVLGVEEEAGTLDVGYGSAPRSRGAGVAVRRS